jgi:uncharacterized membrane protein (UPF0136 family)
LLIAGILLRDKPQQGLMVGGVVSLVLAGWAIYNFFPKHKMMPHGMVFVLGLVGIIMTLVAYSKR